MLFRIKNLYCLLGLLVTYTQSARADFYWWDWYGNRYATPVEACSDPGGMTTHPGYVGVRVKQETFDRYQCWHFYVPYGEWYTNGGVRRFGDRCPLGKIYNAETGLCGSGKDKGKPQVCTGNPINVAVGNKYQQEVDYSPGGSSALEFQRYYNSVDGVWRHSFSTSLNIVGSIITLVKNDGQELAFNSIGNTVVGSPSTSGHMDKLANGWRYTTENNEIYSFDSAGKLASFQNGRVSYAVTRILAKSIVTDNVGNSLEFTEGSSGQLQLVTASGSSISYSYDSSQRLTTVLRTEAGQTVSRLYHYEDSRNTALLTGITDERGVRFATWRYDEDGRAISSEHAGGVERSTVAYNADGSRTVTNELGKKTTYKFTLVDGVSRVTSVVGEPTANCPYSNSTFTYNDRGQVLTQTDAKGFVTTYTYNDRGLETTRTQASGTPQARTTTTTWHATFNLPLTVTEGGQVTTYTYDSQGRQTSRTQTAL